MSEERQGEQIKRFRVEMKSANPIYLPAGGMKTQTSRSSSHYCNLPIESEDIPKVLKLDISFGRHLDQLNRL